MKKCVSRIILYMLYRGIKSAYKLDSELKNELDNLGENFLIEILVFNEKINLKLLKNENKFRKIKKSIDIDEDKKITITFKSLKDFYSVIFFKTSVQLAFCSHKFILEGDIFKAMRITRIINKIENYLLPNFLGKNIPKNDKLCCCKFRFYLKVLFGI